MWEQGIGETYEIIKEIRGKVTSSERLFVFVIDEEVTTSGVNNTIFGWTKYFDVDVKKTNSK